MGSSLMDLRVPPLTETMGGMFVHPSPLPEDLDYVLETDFLIWEKTRVNYPVNLADADSIHRLLVERVGRLVEKMRWDILVKGALTLEFPDTDNSVHIDFGWPDPVEIEDRGELLEFLEMSPDNPKAARIDEEHTHFVLCNSNTAWTEDETEFGNRFLSLKHDSRSHVVYRTNDGGWKHGDAHYFHIPDDIIVVIPMLPPIVGLKEGNAKSILYREEGDHWFIMHTRPVNFWARDNTNVHPKIYKVKNDG